MVELHNAIHHFLLDYQHRHALSPYDVINRFKALAYGTPTSTVAFTVNDIDVQLIIPNQQVSYDISVSVKVSIPSDTPVDQPMIQSIIDRLLFLLE